MLDPGARERNIPIPVSAWKTHQMDSEMEDGNRGAGEGADSGLLSKGGLFFSHVRILGKVPLLLTFTCHPEPE